MDISSKVLDVDIPTPYDRDGKHAMSFAVQWRTEAFTA